MRIKRNEQVALYGQHHKNLMGPGCNIQLGIKEQWHYRKMSDESDHSQYFRRRWLCSSLYILQYPGLGSLNQAKYVERRAVRERKLRSLRHLQIPEQ